MALGSGLVPLEGSVPFRQSLVYCPGGDLHLRSTTVCPSGWMLVRLLGGVACVLAYWAPSAMALDLGRSLTLTLIFRPYHFLRLY